MTSSFDDILGVMEVNQHPHGEIHTGDHYFYNDHVVLADTVTQDYLITTPNTTKWGHFLLSLDGSLETQFEVYEAADRNGTTLQTVFNNNRNSVQTADLTIHKGQSGGTTDGDLLSIYRSGSSSVPSQLPSGARNDNEIVLKQNTKYIVRITSGGNGNLCNAKFDWYEHTNNVAIT